MKQLKIFPRIIYLCPIDSVTGLCYFSKFLLINFLTKVTQYFNEFGTILKNIILSKNCLDTFWATFRKIGLFLFQHLVTMYYSYGHWLPTKICFEWSSTSDHVKDDPRVVVVSRNESGTTHISCRSDDLVAVRVWAHALRSEMRKEKSQQLYKIHHQLEARSDYAVDLLQPGTGSYVANNW